MNNESQHGYMLIFRGNDWHDGLSPSQMQEVAGQWMTWFHGLMERGTAIAGNPLEPSGKVVAGKGGRMVSDGPFAESKETIAGYFLLTVRTEEEAILIAQQCPGLPYGVRVEVRPVAAACPLVVATQKEAASNAAIR